MFHYDRICGSRCFLGWKTFSFSGSGRNIPEILGYEKAEELIREADEIYLKFGADEKVYGLEDMEAIDEIRAKSIRANLKLIECPIRHLGTEEGYKIYARLQKHLEENRVEIRFMTMVQNILMEKGRAVGVVTEKGETFYAAEIVAGVDGKDRSGFLIFVKNMGLKHRMGLWM